MNRLSAALIALAVVACAPRAAQQQQQQAIQIEDDKFSPEATFIGIQVIDNPGSGTFKEWFIRSFVNKQSGDITHQLYVHVGYTGDRRRYEAATDDHATPLPFARIERDRGACKYGNCDYDEDFGLGLRDTVLRERAGTGFQVKVVAHSGDSLILTVAPGQIVPQLATVDAYRRAHSLMGAREPAPVAAFSGQGNEPGRLGVYILLTPPSLAPTLQLPPSTGLLVAAVAQGTAAQKAGIRAGDVILELDGRPTNTFQDLLGPLKAFPAGAAVRLVLWRANARVDTTVQF